MGFVERAFTPPGTGGREAQAIIAQAEARDAAAALAAPKPMPNLPSISAAPPAPPQFAAGQSPGAKKSQATASTMLGAAATGGGQPGGQLAQKRASGASVLG